ncbi:unnamed protein product [Phytophthora lilii]|uniref:Unnamed protein product n=1 Tax=Phytophthora lilii TaxID=2077276 RepID=A0A9W6X8P3_9STRA|nr:unnamed protein product [Phytophthora lilii]
MQCTKKQLIARSGDVCTNKPIRRGVSATFLCDFVLWSRVDSRLADGKLLVRWVGPFQIEDAKSHSFTIKNVLTHSIHEVHGSRLNFYHDPSLELTEEFIDHIST